MSAAPKLKLRFCDGSKLVFLFLLQGPLSKIVKSQAVESIGIGVVIRVEVNCICRGECECTRWNTCPVGEGDGLQGFSLECGC